MTRAREADRRYTCHQVNRSSRALNLGLDQSRRRGTVLSASERAPAFCDSSRSQQLWALAGVRSTAKSRKGRSRHLSSLAPLALQGGYRARSMRGSMNKSDVVERCKRSAPQLRYRLVGVATSTHSSHSRFSMAAVRALIP